MSEIKYTFLLPVYKSAYLEQTLTSIREQEYPNFKVIVSDDCSPDNIKEIFDKVVKGDVRFVYRRNKENMGMDDLIAHWNLLVELCQTEYLILTGDDDLYASYFLREADTTLTKYPHTDLMRARSQIINAMNVVIRQDLPTSQFESQIDFLYASYRMNRIRCIGAYVFRTTALKQYGGFVNFPLAWGSDTATVMKMSRNGVCIPDSISFSFRMSGVNISSIHKKEIVHLKTKARMQIMLFYDRFFKNVPTDGTVLSENRLAETKHLLFFSWTKQMKEMSVYLPLREMIKIYTFLSDRRAFTGFLDKLHFIWTWIKGKKLR